MSLQSCADLVRTGDPDRFLAAMAAPVSARRVLFPLYAFNVEVARAPWVTQEPLIAEMRLAWWREALEEIAAGGRVRRHEVTEPLAEVLDAPAARLLDGAVEARLWCVTREGFADADALAAHLDATAGQLMWVAARALGAGPGAEPVVRDLARAQGLAAWLCAVPRLTASGLAPLPDPSEAAIRRLAGDGLHRLARARAARHKVPSRAAPALLAGWLAGPLLRRAAASPVRVAEGRLAVPEFSRRLALLLRSVSGRW